ncbi:259_t:CDS:2 [Ambispora leptoticha]|uniref:259_t:CDS:1 n=1 Tax=Ambispora leptoticha TaxID=144679 RepID=A0A9N8VY73_9GLOM|nr:259_t:CDS:2 [Ambispora leptoticha]
MPNIINSSQTSFSENGFQTAPSNKGKETIQSIVTSAKSLLREALPTVPQATTSSLASINQTNGKTIGDSSTHASVSTNLDWETNFKEHLGSQSVEGSNFSISRSNFRSENDHSYGSQEWEDWVSPETSLDKFVIPPNSHAETVFQSAKFETDIPNEGKKTHNMPDGAEVIDFLNSNSFTAEIYCPIDTGHEIEKHRDHFLSPNTKNLGPASSYINALIDAEDIVAYLRETRYTDDVYGIPNFLKTAINEALNEEKQNQVTETHRQTALKRLEMKRVEKLIDRMNNHSDIINNDWREEFDLSWHKNRDPSFLSCVCMSPTTMTRRTPRKNKEQMFEVEKVLDEKQEDGQRFLLIQWKGIDPDTRIKWEPTWEPEEYCTLAVVQDWNRQKENRLDATTTNNNSINSINEVVRTERPKRSLYKRRTPLSEQYTPRFVNFPGVNASPDAKARFIQRFPTSYVNMEEAEEEVVIFSNDIINSSKFNSNDGLHSSNISNNMIDNNDQSIDFIESSSSVSQNSQAAIFNNKLGKSIMIPAPISYAQQKLYIMMYNDQDGVKQQLKVSSISHPVASLDSPIFKKLNQLNTLCDNPRFLDSSISSSSSYLYALDEPGKLLLLKNLLPRLSLNEHNLSIAIAVQPSLMNTMQEYLHKIHISFQVIESIENINLQSRFYLISTDFTGPPNRIHELPKFDFSIAYDSTYDHRKLWMHSTYHTSLPVLRLVSQDTSEHGYVYMLQKYADLSLRNCRLFDLKRILDFGINVRNGHTSVGISPIHEHFTLICNKIITWVRSGFRNSLDFGMEESARQWFEMSVIPLPSKIPALNNTRNTLRTRHISDSNKRSEKSIPGKKRKKGGIIKDSDNESNLGSSKKQNKSTKIIDDLSAQVISTPGPSKNAHTATEPRSAYSDPRQELESIREKNKRLEAELQLFKAALKLAEEEAIYQRSIAQLLEEQNRRSDDQRRLAWVKDMLNSRSTQKEEFEAFVCDWNGCNKIFRSKDDLKVHLRSDHCSDRFASSASWNGMRVDAGSTWVDLGFWFNFELI